jgi:hypothetical protein
VPCRYINRQPGQSGAQLGGQHPDDQEHPVHAGGDAPGGLLAGDQIVVEAKLRASMEVLAQVLPSIYERRRDGRGPDFFAVLVPERSTAFRDVAEAVGVAVLTWPNLVPGTAAYRVGRDQPFTLASRHRHYHAGPLDLGLRVEMAAGRPGPRSVTPWKVAAVKLCLTGLTRTLHRADFAPPLRLPLFLERGWVLAAGRGKTATFALADDCAGRPDRAYPEIVAALQRDGWTSPEGPPAPLLTPRRR